MKIIMKHLGWIGNGIMYFERDTLPAIEDIEKRLVETASRLPQELEAQDMALVSQKLTDTAQVDIARLSQSVAAFADTMQAVKSNYQQAQIRTLERILKIDY